MFALIISDGHFNLPQNLLVNIADRSTEGSNGLRGVKIKDTQEILMIKVGSRLHTAARHQRIGDAHGSGISELHPYVELIIFLQERIVNDGEDVSLMLIPVFAGKPDSNLFKLIGETACFGNIIIALQHIGNSIVVFLTKLPQPDSAGIVSAARIGNIEYIFELRPVTGGVDNGNAFASAPDISAHALVPEVILGAGGGVRALGIDHELLVVRVLIQPRSSGEKIRPLFVAAGDLRRRMVCHLCVNL